MRESLALLCGREIVREDSRSIEMAIGLACFPYVRDLAAGCFIAVAQRSVP